MVDVKDPAIRLFGRTIQLAPNDDVSACYSTGSVSFQSTSDNKSPADAINPGDHCSSSSSIPGKMNQDQSSSKSSMVSGSPSRSEEGGGCSESPLKKPTKILPCPRCNSSDTKFCYFNNYNVNQPRHFCKVCQRYWTAGGSMRNMAVGAGRRKNKNNNSNSNSSCVDGNGAVINQDPQNPATITFQGYAPQYPVWPGPLPCHGFLPVPIYGPTPYWGWNATWMAPASASAELRPLGKHPREESTVLVPKTLRFDDPTEAAKSSIWTTLGMKSQRSGGAFFGGVHAKAEEESSSSTTRLLQANPAALSRSLTFLESAESEIKAGVQRT